MQPMNDNLTDHHRGDDATITIPLRTALDLWMLADNDKFHGEAEFTKALDDASRDAGFDGHVEAFHFCGPGVHTNAEGTRGQRVYL